MQLLFSSFRFSPGLRRLVAMTITVSTDGSALGNPNGPMGWAWADHAVNAARTHGHQHDGDSDAGGATNGTNQIGELCAVLEALRAHRGTEPLTIETDSQYAINCSTTWVKGWKKNGWKNSQKKPVKNAPLIKAIDAEIGRRKGPVKFVWVKGHNGNPGNEKVDDLAHTYSGDARSGLKDGYLPLEGWQSLLASPYAKGVDIPADAKMLIDGKITEEQYHLGRGVESGDDGDGWDDSEDNDNPASNRNVDDHDRLGEKRTADDGANGNPGSQTSHRPTLAERLAEPEGVPEYDFSPRKPIVAHHRAVENDESADTGNHIDGSTGGDSDESHSAGRTVRSHPDFISSNVDDATIPADNDDSAATETQLPVTQKAGKTAASAPSQNSTDAEANGTNAGLNQTNDKKTSETATVSDSDDLYDNVPDTDDDSLTNDNQNAESDSDSTENANNTNSIENANNHDGANNEDFGNHQTDNETGRVGSENAQDDSVQSDEPTEADDPAQSDGNGEPGDGNTNENNTESTDTTPDKRPEPQAKQAPAYLHSGLSVSGTLRFVPAPQTSPTYNGQPRHIRGVIAIDGYVAGDGTIVLSNAPFLIANNNHKK